MRRLTSAWVLLLGLALTLGLGPLCPVHADDDHSEAFASCSFCKVAEAGVTLPELAVCAPVIERTCRFAPDAAADAASAPEHASGPRAPPALSD